MAVFRKVFLLNIIIINSHEEVALQWIFFYNFKCQTAVCIVKIVHRIVMLKFYG